MRWRGTSGKPAQPREATVRAAHTIYSHGREFELFLYAHVGEDRNGHAVTVLSTLARLGLDPWKEAAELTALGRDAAHSRLGLLLSRFRDVPALGQDHETVARELARLLPELRARVAAIPVGAAKGAAMSSGLIWLLLAVLVVVVQMMFAGSTGSDE